MNRFLFLAIFLFGAMGLFSEEKAGLYNFSVKDIAGKNLDLSEYRGKVVLIVNTASRCGYTPQYEGLETLYKTYKDKNFVILAFPTNDFLGQEPGTNEEIAAFCTLNYNISFPLFSKVSLSGQKSEPLFKWLTSVKNEKVKAGPITWNFNKFLLDKNGNLVARWESNTIPLSPEIKSKVEELLR